jgi:lysyl-tRNA synthetase class 2
MTKPTPVDLPWFHPSRHEDRRGFLLARNRILAATRAWFAERDFLEVDVPALQVSPGNEAHLHGFETRLIHSDGSTSTRYLHTSPEFACKKLLAAGEERIFYLGHVFRNRERTATHAPEFTMLEWYRAGETYDAVVADCLAILKLAATAVGNPVFRFRGREADVTRPPQRIGVVDAFREFASIDLFETLGEDGTPKTAAMARAAATAGIKTAADDSWSDMFSRVLTERVEPRLGIGAPTILDRYPRAEAALARACAGDPRLAERFELYVCGVELANGFGELTDPDEQRRRFEAEMDEKQRIHGERYPIDEDFLAALAQMPDASGVALGFDRLVMLSTGAPSIDQIIWTPMVR